MTIVDEIKQRVDIVQLVSEYVALQKAGRNFKAQCPFHTEKHGSFFVFPERQTWHCFGACGIGGDIFSFLMKKEGIDFGEALQILSERSGVSLNSASKQRREDEDRSKNRLHQINEAAAQFYHHLLLDATPDHKAREYIERRGLSLQTVKDFQIGYSPDSWDALKQYLINKGYDKKELIAAGLEIPRDDGSSYDRFRNRLMFPIRNIKGSVTGFGARSLDDSLPKYINSPETPVFDKSSSLYGIDRAKTAIRRDNRVIITEGYMDVITAHQHGWENVVASMGTAVTDKQLAILRKLATNLMLALDADSAGQEAIVRSGEIVDKMLPVPPLLYGWVKYEDAHNAEVKVIVLPSGTDPDSLIKEDVSQWKRLINQAKPLLDFIINNEIVKTNWANPREKSAAVEKLLRLLSEIDDPLRRGHYVQRIAQLLKIDSRDLSDALRKLHAKKKQGAIKEIRGHSRFNTVVNTTSDSRQREEYCLALLLQFPELKPEGTKVSPDYFAYPENKEVFLKWLENQDIVALRKNLSVLLHDHLDTLLARSFPPTLRENEIGRRNELNDCIIRMQERLLRNLEIKKEELLAIEAETGGVQAELAKLEEQGTKISERLKEVFAKRVRQREATSKRSRP